MIPVVVIVFALFVLCALARLIYGPALTPEGRGKEGEESVFYELSSHLDTHRYKIFNDVMLRTKKGITTQIDHVVVSQYGVFVIETKNISGWVFASETSSQWTSTLPARGYSRYWDACHKYRFQNPIRQNFLHVSTLDWQLKLPRSAVRGLVAFPDKTDFKRGYPAGVFTYSSIAHEIQRYDRKIFDVRTTRAIAGAIAAANARISASSA